MTGHTESVVTALTHQRLMRAELERELEQLHPARFAWALGCCRRNRDDAEEVLQNVYVKVLEGAASFDGRSTLKTWLFAVIRGTATVYYRRRSLRDALFLRFFIGAEATEATTTTASDLAG